MAPKLISIAHDGPVLAHCHLDGLEWTVTPDRFDALVEHINAYGGPSFWSISPA